MSSSTGAREDDRYIFLYYFTYIHKEEKIINHLHLVQRDVHVQRRNLFRQYFHRYPLNTIH